MNSIPAPSVARHVTDPTGPALRHLAGVAVVIVAAVAGTYGVPALERARPWVPGEPLPLEGLARALTSKGIPKVEGGPSGAYTDPGQVALDPTIAKNLGEPKPVVRHGAPIAVDPSEYADIKVHIEGAEHLRGFFAALKETALGKPGAITRVAHYGDSSIASDYITSTARRLLQTRFGDAGHGFVLIDRGTMPYAHSDLYMRGDHGWALRQLVRNEDRDGFYGYGGVKYRGSPGNWATFGTVAEGPIGQRISRFELFYRAHPRGGKVAITVDRKQKTVVSTQGEPRDDFAVVTMADGPHRVDVRPEGYVELYGVVLERDVPGVVYDSLGMVGARARRLLNFNASHIQGQLAHRKPNLLVLGFGGNEADDYQQAIVGHEAEIREVIRLMRHGQEQLPCLVFAPLDQAHRDSRGNVKTFKSIPMLVDQQRSAAKLEGCAFYNTFEAMGGEGSMAAWTRTRPKLAVSDLRHATPEGYAVIGTMFYKALLKAFADHTR